jgi:hypothetical protein
LSIAAREHETSRDRDSKNLKSYKREVSQFVLFTKYYYGDHIMVDRWTGYVIQMWHVENAYKIFIGEPEGNAPLWRFWLTWE